MTNKDALLVTLNQLQLYTVINYLNVQNINDQYTDNEYKLINQLLEHESIFRQSRHLNYRIKISRFPVIRLLKDTIQSQLLQKISITDIIEHNRNIMFIGNAGSGKTHLSLAVGYDLIVKGYKVIYYKLHELAYILLKHTAINTHRKFFNQCKSFDMVIIDEFAYIPIDEQASYLLYELFSILYCNNTILINTHLRFEEWGNLFGIEKTTKVIIDRITQNCHIIETGNKSFRHK